MRKDRVIDSLGRIDDDMVQAVEALRRKKKRPAWTKWGALVACLCLVAAIAIPSVLFQPAESPNDTMEPSDGPSNLVVNGMNYLISSYLAVSEELPDGFTLAGEADVGGFEGCPYFVNPDIPEWVYVYQEVMTDGTVGSTGALRRTEPHHAYVRYVDIRLRGKGLISYNGEYFISMWSADTYGNFPDVSNEYYHTMENTYGIRMEGEAPDGFVFAGIAAFSGHDTIPRGALSSNEGAYEVFVNPNEPDIVLVPTQWYTAASDENGETRHEGFHVYIRYDCPLT